MIPGKNFKHVSRKFQLLYLLLVFYHNSWQTEPKHPYRQMKARNKASAVMLQIHITSATWHKEREHHPDDDAVAWYYFLTHFKIQSTRLLNAGICKAGFLTHPRPTLPSRNISSDFLLRRPFDLGPTVAGLFRILTGFPFNHAPSLRQTISVNLCDDKINIFSLNNKKSA